MNFLRSKAEQLADYLRGCLARGELVEPLPGTRAWSRQLGVSRSTLDEALRVLRRERLVWVDANRGIRLTAAPRSPARSSVTAPRLVRVIYYGRDIPELHKDLLWMMDLAEQLHAHGVQLSIEKCTEARLKAYARARQVGTELLILISLPAKFQTLFDQANRAVLLTGEPAPGVQLPFLTSDLDGAIRHATCRLLRRGFERVTLVLPRTRSPGLQRAKQVFVSACADWSRQPVRGDVVFLPLEMPAMVTAAGRFAKTVRDRRGIVTMDNIPVGLIMTALAARGVAIPQQVELVAFAASAESLKVFPSPAHYLSVLPAFAQTLARAALHYFQTGDVPRLRKRLPMEMVPGGEASLA